MSDEMDRTSLTPTVQAIPLGDSVTERCAEHATDIDGSLDCPVCVRTTKLFKDKDR